MSSTENADVKYLVEKCVLLGLIDRIYQIEVLYKKGDLQQAAFILSCLRTGLLELSE